MCSNSESSLFIIAVESELPGLFEAETRAKSFLKSVWVHDNGRMKRRVRTGMIVTECCINRCTTGIIESYCNPLPDESQHMESVHVRLSKSAEQDASEKISERPQDGLEQTDNAQEDARDADPATTRVGNRVEEVEEVLAERITLTVTPSNGKKARKDKNDRRKSSREAKAARREQRRRNRERASGGKSRSVRRKNKATDRSPRARRHSPLPWETSFETEVRIRNMFK